MEKVFIDLNENSYLINIECGLLSSLSSYIGEADKWLIVTDSNVDKLYSDIVEKSLQEKDLYKIVIKAGEESKNFSKVEDILRKMIEIGLSRRSKVLALGGGVVGDIAGFCASIYMRGIPFIQIPTTLLAQVDSSVGGKTGVNMSEGKNLIGSFYQPESVVIDTSTLKTLDKRELISGIGEIIKYGIIWDYDFFNEIKSNFTRILEGDLVFIDKLIKRCCEIKAEIVSQDEREKGLRKILNHGHTLAHALEAISDYKKYTHGQAVLIGMYYESLMSKKLGYIKEDYFKEIEELIKLSDICLDISEFKKDMLKDYMMKDKKNRSSKISFILPKGRAKVEEVLLARSEVKW